MRILLKEFMEEKNLSLRQVEIMTGVSRSALSRICHGEISPTMDVMEKLALGLHMDIVDLFEWPGIPKKRPDIGTTHHNR